MPRWLVFVIGVAFAAIAAVWAARQFVPAGGAVAPTSITERSQATRGDSTSPLGTNVPASGATAGAAGGRFKLVGVLANGSEGFALIAVDGHPARAFRVGATVEGNLVVQGVSAHGATLGPSGGGAPIELEVARAPAPATPAAPASAEGLERVSKYPPLPPQTWSAPKKPGDGPAQSGDDGSWKPGQ